MKFSIIIFQDCHEDTENEILVKDTVQNYELLGGYENSTHTVILFSRRLDTCDREHDVSLTVRINNKTTVIFNRVYYFLNIY